MQENSLLSMILFIRYILIVLTSSIVAKYLFSFIAPKDMRDPFDKFVLGFRSSIAGKIETTFRDNTNFEVVFLSRIVAPVAFFILLDSLLISLWARWQTFNFSLILYFVYIMFKLYLFLNIGPSIDEVRIISETTSITRIIFLLKLFFYFLLEDVMMRVLGILGLATFFGAEYVPFYLILLFPISSFIGINHWWPADESIKIETITEQTNGSHTLSNLDV